MFKFGTEKKNELTFEGRHVYVWLIDIRERRTENTLFIFYKNQVFSAQPGKRDRDNYRQLTTMFLNFELI